MKYLISILFLFLITSCSVEHKVNVDFLIGEWKMENRESYEVWEKDADNNLIGYSYSIKDGEKKVSETLAIKISGDRIVFEATVPTQNEGKTIGFELNTKIDSLLSFENDKHDFPNKIQYKMITKDKIKVSVKGNERKGFSYIQIKQSQK